MADKTVTMSDQEWQQLVAILANATGYLTFQKLVGQLQAQDGPQRLKDPLEEQTPRGGLPESLRRMTQP